MSYEPAYPDEDGQPAWKEGTGQTPVTATWLNSLETFLMSVIGEYRRVAYIEVPGGLILPSTTLADLFVVTSADEPAVRAVSTAYSPGNRISEETNPTLDPQYWTATMASGISGEVEPDWPTSVTDGTIIWRLLPLWNDGTGTWMDTSIPGSYVIVADGSIWANVADGQLGTTAATMPNWTLAPDLGDTITDGTVTWMRVGTVVAWAAETPYSIHLWDREAGAYSHAVLTGDGHAAVVASSSEVVGVTDDIDVAFFDLAEGDGYVVDGGVLWSGSESDQDVAPVLTVDPRNEGAYLLIYNLAADALLVLASDVSETLEPGEGLALASVTVDGDLTWMLGWSSGGVGVASVNGHFGPTVVLDADDVGAASVASVTAAQGAADAAQGTADAAGSAATAAQGAADAAGSAAGAAQGAADAAQATADAAIPQGGPLTVELVTGGFLLKATDSGGAEATVGPTADASGGGWYALGQHPDGGVVVESLVAGTTHSEWAMQMVHASGDTIVLAMATDYGVIYSRTGDPGSGFAGDFVIGQGGTTNVRALWKGTQAEYAAVDPKESQTLYIASDTGRIYLGSTLVAEVAPAGVTVTDVAGTSDTIGAGDLGKLLRYTDAGLVTVTLPHGLAIGSQVNLLAWGAAGLAIQDNGTSVVQPEGAVAQYAEVSCVVVAANTWSVQGAVT